MTPESDIQPTGMQQQNESPEDAKSRTKNKVARGVAKLAGALEGFTSKAKEEDLSHKAEDALHKAGETTRKLSQLARQEFSDTKKAVKQKPDESSHEGGEQQAGQRPERQGMEQQQLGAAGQGSMSSGQQPGTTPSKDPSRRSMRSGGSTSQDK